MTACRLGHPRLLHAKATVSKAPLTRLPWTNTDSVPALPRCEHGALVVNDRAR
jgi:hypothetical protein